MTNNNAKQNEIDRKVLEYTKVARAELARLTRLVASLESKASDDPASASQLATWADVTESATIARSLKDTSTYFKA